jgi:hypothetical protein
MAAEIPSDIPNELRAGNTWEWTKTHDDYSSVSYTLKYYLVQSQISASSKRYTGAMASRGSSVITITAVADGEGGWDVSVSGTTNAAYLPGRYEYVARVEDGSGGNYEIDSGFVDVLENIAARQAGHDGRTHAEYMLDLCIKAEENLLSGRPVQSYQYGSRNFQYMTLTEVRQERAEWQAQVDAERGVGGLSFISARFV